MLHLRRTDKDLMKFTGRELGWTFFVCTGEEDIYYKTLMESHRYYSLVHGKWYKSECFSLKIYPKEGCKPIDIFDELKEEYYDALKKE